MHTYETSHALIDTSGLHVVLPPPVAEQLGLLLMGYTGATMADGRLIEGEMSEPVLIAILRHQIPLAAIVMGDTIVLGAMVLEGLALAVDGARGRLMPNLGTWDQPMLRV